MKFLYTLLTTLLLTTSLHAEPTRLSIVVGGPVGGALDNIGRILKDQIELQHPTEYKVEVLNRPGNGPVAAAAFFTNDKNIPHANEVQILLTVSSVLIPIHIQQTLPTDTDQKLKPLVIIGKMRPLIHANPNFPISNLKDIDSLGRTHISYTTPGPATTLNLIAEQIQKQIKTPLIHVPVPSTPNALNMVMGNHVDLVFDVGQYYTTATSGKTKIISVISDDNWTEFSNSLLIAKQLPSRIDHDLSYYMVFGNAKNNPVLQEKISQDLKTLVAENQQFQRLLKNLQLGMPSRQELNNPANTWTNLIKTFKKLSSDSALKK